MSAIALLEVVLLCEEDEIRCELIILLLFIYFIIILFSIYRTTHIPRKLHEFSHESCQKSALRN